MFINRHLEGSILKASKTYPILLITGPRQIGKRTLLKNIANSKRTYVTLDNPAVRELAQSDPELFMQRYQPPVLIDEIQYAPQLFPYIKMHVDEHQRKGDYWLTGSQMFHLMKNVSESLAGRVAIIPMQGLSTSELNKVSNIPYTTETKILKNKIDIRNNMDVREVFERILKGSMPALYNDQHDIETFYSSYVNTYLQRDIRDLTQVGDELTFMRFMRACAVRTGQLVNYADIAKDIGISPPTAKQWLSILYSSGLIVLIEPYYNNLLKRIVKTPRMYFMDTGLCAWLSRWTSAETLEISAMSGAFFETYVVSEIIKTYLNAGKMPPLYYYRDTDGKEIDLIIEQNGILHPIEIKKSGAPKKEAIKHFNVLESTGKEIGNGNVICLSKELLPLDRKNYIVPVSFI